MEVPEADGDIASELEADAAVTVADAAVSVAESAVALSEQTAAAAELQAAEMVADNQAELDEWQRTTSAEISELRAAMTSISEGMLSLREAITSTQQALAALAVVTETIAEPEVEEVAGTENPSSGAAENQEVKTPVRKRHRWA